MSLTKAQALEMFESDDLIGIGMEADAVRRKLHPEGVVTYIIDRNINYTNFCTEYCTFCAFYRPLKGPAGEGRLHPRLRNDLRQDSRDRGTWRHRCIDAGRIASRPQDRLAREDAARNQSSAFRKSICIATPRQKLSRSPSTARLSIRDTILRLRDAGLDSIPGGGAEILDDEVRYKIARLKCLTDDWLERASHRAPDRNAHDCDHDVRRRRELRKSHQPSPEALRICRKRLADSRHSFRGASSRRTPRSADATGTKRPRSNT